MMQSPVTKTAWAASRSVVFLLVSLRNMREGKMTQMTDPMVEPTMPRTNSMSGIMMPSAMVTSITITVMELKRTGGMAVPALAELIGMSYMGTKQHCLKLVETGYVESWRVPRVRVGRPEVLYRLTRRAEGLFPFAGVEVTMGLLEAAESLLSESFAPARTVVFAFGHDEEISGRDGAVKLAARMQELGLHFAWMVDEGGMVISDNPIFPKNGTR